jgi:hypothetical protein
MIAPNEKAQSRRDVSRVAGPSLPDRSEAYSVRFPDADQPTRISVCNG